MGIGFIIRDHAGETVAMMCANKGYVTDPTLAEALGVLQAADLVRQLDMHRVTLEGDALSIVQAMQKEGECCSAFGQVVNDAKEMMSRCQSRAVQHVNRTANESAHCLAKIALMMDENRLWRGDFPSCIEDYVCTEP